MKTILTQMRDASNCRDVTDTSVERRVWVDIDDNQWRGNRTLSTNEFHLRPLVSLRGIHLCHQHVINMSSPSSSSRRHLFLWFPLTSICCFRKCYMPIKHFANYSNKKLSYSLESARQQCISLQISYFLSPYWSTLTSITSATYVRQICYAYNE